VSQTMAGIVTPPVTAGGLQGVAPPGYGASAPRRFPDFLGIGAQKAGTTWLFANLRRHPGVWMPPVKELQYFNDLYFPAHRRWTGTHRRTHGIRSLMGYLDRTPPERWNFRYIARTADIISGPICDEWYGSIFTLATDDQICGEITPAYALLPPTGIEHLLRLAPDVKILYALRDPIDRNWSHIRQIARSENQPDLRRIASHPELVEHANYPKLISRWAALVSTSRLLLIFADDMLARPEHVISEICRHLDIEYDVKYFPDLAIPQHVGDAMEIPGDIYTLLKAQLRPVYDDIIRLRPEVGRRWLAKHYG
jgi:hypothetical protein